MMVNMYTRITPSNVVIANCLMGFVTARITLRKIGLIMMTSIRWNVFSQPYAHGTTTVRTSACTHTRTYRGGANVCVWMLAHLSEHPSYSGDDVEQIESGVSLAECVIGGGIHQLPLISRVLQAARRACRRHGDTNVLPKTL